MPFLNNGLTLAYLNSFGTVFDEIDILIIWVIGPLISDAASLINFACIPSIPQLFFGFYLHNSKLTKFSKNAPAVHAPPPVLFPELFMSPTFPFILSLWSSKIGNYHICSS